MSIIKNSALLVALAFFGFRLSGQESNTLEATPKVTDLKDQEAAPNSVDEQEKKGTDTTNHQQVRTGATLLPDGVSRFKFLYNAINGKTGLDGSGNPVDNGIAVSMGAGSLIFEHGISSKTSFRFTAPYIFSASAGVNADKFKESKLFREEYNSYKSRVADILLAQGVCESAEDCNQYIDEGKGLPVNSTFEIDGENINLNADVPIKDAIESAVINSASFENGMTGLGDIELGIGHNFDSEGSFQWTLGSLLSLPTGSFENVPASKLTTGTGRYVLTLAAILGWRPSPLIDFTYTHLLKKELTKAKRKKSKLGNAKEFAEPETKHSFQRKDFIHLGFL